MATHVTCLVTCGVMPLSYQNFFKISQNVNYFMSCHEELREKLLKVKNEIILLAASKSCANTISTLKLSMVLKKKQMNLT